MDEYRLYHRRGGSLAYSGAFRCDRDEMAIILAEDALEGRAGELWCGSRLVKIFDATDGPTRHDGGSGR